jgi:hypothetical protein
MMTPDEYMEAKSRLMHSSTIVKALAGLDGDEELQFTAEAYEEAIGCLVMMEDDLKCVLAELDVLRGMFDSSVNRFLKGIKDDANDFTVERNAAELQEEVSPFTGEEQGDASDSEQGGSDVGDSRPAKKKSTNSRRKKASDDDAATDKRSGGRRSSGKRAKRPKSTRDKGGDETDS